MYNQAIASLALLEVYSITGEQELREPITKALAFMHTAQTKEGGWGYTGQYLQTPNTSITAWQWVDATLTGVGDPSIVYAAGVSSGMLTTLGLQPFMGRDIRPEETVRGGPLVAVISYSFWQDRLGGDENVLGRTLQLSSRTFQIIGVAPPDFTYPRSAALWISGGWSEETHPRGRHFLRAIGRLGPGVPIETAQAELSEIASRLEAQYPGTNAARGIHLVSLKDQTVGDVRVALLILLGAALGAYCLFLFWCLRH